MKDLSLLDYFFGIVVTRHKHDLFFNQSTYANDIMQARMTNYKPCPTPIDTNNKLNSTVGNPYSNPHLYRSLASALQYLTLTHLDISYVIQ